MSPRVLKGVLLHPEDTGSRNRLRQRNRPVSCPESACSKNTGLSTQTPDSGKYSISRSWRTPVHGSRFPVGHPFSRHLLTAWRQACSARKSRWEKYIVVDYVDYKVVGVVKEVTTAASDAMPKSGCLTVNADMQRACGM